MPRAQLFTGFRLDRHDNPLTPRLHARGRFRFDAPRGEFPVIYACSDRSGCFAEVFGDTQLVDDPDTARHVFNLRSTRPLLLLELDDGAVTMSFGLDARISTIKPYRRPQLWSRAFHDWYPELDGLRYTPRHATGKTNFCLYLDRCAADLEAADDGTLGNRLDLVEEALRAYPLACTFLA